MKTSSFTKDSQMKNRSKESTSFNEKPTATTSSLDVSENPSERISSFNGQTFVLEYLAPRRSCRVNVVITAFANGRYYLFVPLKNAVDMYIIKIVTSTSVHSFSLIFQISN